MIARASKSGGWFFTFSAEEMSDGGAGGCLACGAEAFDVEPDARRYRCECCGELRVYGAEELLLIGRADLTEECGE
jgi:hypothetical protein